MVQFIIEVSSCTGQHNNMGELICSVCAINNPIATIAVLRYAHFCKAHLDFMTLRGNCYIFARFYNL